MIAIPVGTSDLARSIIRRAQQDIPILENPPLSNRSPEIDEMCKRWGVPLGSYWCALWATTVWADAGAAIPPVSLDKDWHPAKCETWRQWSLRENLFTSEPSIGCAVLYGKNGHEPAEHIGVCLASVVPVKMDFEGNTSGAGYDRNGELATIKLVDVSRVIGYITPRAA